MKTFAIYCTDKPDTAQKRRDARDAHFSHIEKTLDNFLIAGPLNDKDGVTIGSLLIVKADDASHARKLLESDPYFRIDIWQDIRISEFIPAAGDWIGGKIW
ncbi:YciI family protein [Parasphingorhabdus sp. JC815]|uniref:YciI family protein n=1 Tax=Parasphingorhabdus sp. JC815 TaxID=3232140 RepID=UPI0034590889